MSDFLSLAEGFCANGAGGRGRGKRETDKTDLVAAHFFAPFFFLQVEQLQIDPDLIALPVARNVFRHIRHKHR